MVGMKEFALEGRKEGRKGVSRDVWCCRVVCPPTPAATKTWLAVTLAKHNTLPWWPRYESHNYYCSTVHQPQPHTRIYILAIMHTHLLYTNIHIIILPIYASLVLFLLVSLFSFVFPLSSSFSLLVALFVTVQSVIPNTPLLTLSLLLLSSSLL